MRTQDVRLKRTGDLGADYKPGGRRRTALGRPVWVALILGVLGAGCHTTNNPSAAEATASVTAAVQIRGNTPGQLTQAATEVFQQHGYIRGSKRVGPLVFEKPGSKFSNLAYGNWMGESPIWIRVKLSIVPSGEQQYTLQCQAFHVRDKGGATEEELKIGKMGNGPYQKLLDEIASRFKGARVSQPSTSPSPGE